MIDIFLEFSSCSHNNLYSSQEKSQERWDLPLYFCSAQKSLDIVVQVGIRSWSKSSMDRYWVSVEGCWWDVVKDHVSWWDALVAARHCLFLSVTGHCIIKVSIPSFLSVVCLPPSEWSMSTSSSLHCFCCVSENQNNWSIELEACRVLNSYNYT